MDALAAELKALKEKEKKTERVRLRYEIVLLEAAELELKQLQHIESERELEKKRKEEELEYIQRERAERLRKEKRYWKKEKIALNIAFHQALIQNDNYVDLRGGDLEQELKSFLQK